MDNHKIVTGIDNPELVNDLMKAFGIDQLENVTGFTLKVYLNDPIEVTVQILISESEFDHEHKYNLIAIEEKPSKPRSLNRKPDKGEVESVVKESTPKLNQK